MGRSREGSGSRIEAAEQVVLVDLDDGVHPVAQVELRQYPRDMGLPCLFSDEQHGCDLRVGPPTGQFQQNLLLACRQSVLCAEFDRPAGERGTMPDVKELA